MPFTGATFGRFVTRRRLRPSVSPGASAAADAPDAAATPTCPQPDWAVKSVSAHGVIEAHAAAPPAHSSGWATALGAAKASNARHAARGTLRRTAMLSSFDSLAPSAMGA